MKGAGSDRHLDVDVLGGSGIGHSDLSDFGGALHELELAELRCEQRRRVITKGH